MINFMEKESLKFLVLIHLLEICNKIKDMVMDKFYSLIKLFSMENFIKIKFFTEQ